MYRLADYLDQHGRRHRAEVFPPKGFWTATSRHACPGDQDALSDAARSRGLYRVAAQLCKNAFTVTGDPVTAGRLVNWMHDLHPQDLRAAQSAAASASLDDPAAVAQLLDTLRAAGVGQQITILLARDPAANTSIDNLRHRLPVVLVQAEARPGDPPISGVICVTRTCRRALASEPFSAPTVP